MMENKVGILGIEVYFPSTFVSQSDLEVANGVSSGKYTKGLGQEEMAFTGDREDVNSIALTVVHALLEKYNVDKAKVGRLEVGTESLVDKSKSTKTVLMSLFADVDNTDIEGATVINACYGGTAALLNAATWVDSNSWDGRYAIVVAADIAVYADGPARPTGGCGSVALLIGRDAPLIMDLRSRASHATHVWDFFKPNLDSEYPEVNGILSQKCYLEAVEKCYNSHLIKLKNTYGEEFRCNDIDHFLFHSPYNKLVQKGYGRVIFQDMVQGRTESKEISAWLTKAPEETFEDKNLENLLKTLSSSSFDKKVDPSCQLSKQIGNTYTAAVYMNLANLISTRGEFLRGERIALFSYGSGAIATMFELRGAEEPCRLEGNPLFTLEYMQRSLNLPARLASREQLTPADLGEALQTRENSHGFVPYTPLYNVSRMFPGTYFLAEICSNYERMYARKPLNADHCKDDGPLLLRPFENTSISVDSEADSPLYLEGDADTTIAASETSSYSESNSTLHDSTVGNGLHRNQTNGHSIQTSASGNSLMGTSLGKHGAAVAVAVATPMLGSRPPALGLHKVATEVFASGKQSVNVVVTGVAAALPGYSAGVDCIHRLIQGENFIAPISSAVQADMLNKNVNYLSKDKDGNQVKVPVTAADSIKLCTPIGQPDLKVYGISESIASTMDRAVQVSVAAGLEALKDAGILSGEGENGWVLPVSLQDTTGVVYATSFPALDAAISEVTRYFASQSIENKTISTIVATLRARLEARLDNDMSQACESALAALEAAALAAVDEKPVQPYEFDRKFLFRVLVLGNAQLAQIIKARGPNMQTNAACAGSTQAIALAYDMIQLGRAERMVVIAGDNASSDSLMPWLGNGFRALGAATTCCDVRLAAIPFDERRSGMILGAGGIGMVLESEAGARRRFVAASQACLSTGSRLPMRKAFKCRLLASLYSNSAFHGAAMDRKHIAFEMERFISSIENEHGISRKEIARHGVYFSHETSTHASASASCASNEIHGLRAVFGDNLNNLLIVNTKGFTGHPMGVSFEDVVATEVLVSGTVPPMANNPVPDPALGPGLRLSAGGPYPCKYALRFAAGFGSQIALALYGVE